MKKPRDFDCQCDDRPFEEGGKQYQQRVTLVHQSVKDYLLNNQADTRMKFHVRDPRRMHEEIATRLMEEIRNGCVEDAEKYWRWSLSRRLAWPFGIYSIRNWDYHFLQVSDYRAFAQLHGDFFRDRSALRAKWYVCRRYYRKHRTSLLAVACEFDWEGPARRLLQLRTEQFGSREVEVYVNEYFEDEDSAVMNVACHFGHLNMVTLLLEYGANPNWPALTEYCWRFDDPTTFAQMVARGGGKELLEAKGGDLLIEAARHGRANICDLLIETYGVPVDAKNRVGKTALSSALVFGHMELAHILVNEWRASTDDHWQLLKSIKSRFPYHSDATGTHFQNLLHFIKRWGININASDPSTGRGLVHYDEIRYLKKEDVESLLRLGLDLSAQDHWGNTILHTMHDLPGATLGGLVGMDVLLLLRQDERLNVDGVNVNGETALHLFTSSISTKTRYILLEDHIKGSWQMVKNLLDLGADRNLKNNRGKSPLDLAYKGVVENEWESYLSQTLLSCLSFSSDEDEDNMVYEYKVDFFHVLCNYATAPLFRPTSEEVEAETADSHHAEESSIQTLSAGAERSGQALHYVSSFFHDQRGRWFGRPRRRRVIGI